MRPRYLTLNDVAAELRWPPLTKKAYLERAKRRNLPMWRDAGQWLIERNEFERWKADQPRLITHPTGLDLGAYR